MVAEYQTGMSHANVEEKMWVRTSVGQHPFILCSGLTYNPTPGYSEGLIYAAPPTPPVSLKPTLPPVAASAFASAAAAAAFELSS